MDDYENMYKTICRLCLSRSSADKMVTLIDNSTEDGLSCFGKAVATVTNVLLLKDDKLPTVMCHKCVYLLKQTIYFKLKCESTDKQLKLLVNKKVKTEASDRNLKEIVCQYVMFNQYFPAQPRGDTSRTNNVPKKRVKNDRLIHKTDQKTLDEKGELNIDLSDKTYDFDDFINNDDNKTNFNNQQEEYTNEIDNILDQIQGMINTENIVSNKSSKRRIKREQKYRVQSPHNYKIKREPRYRMKSTNERNLICKVCHKILANRFTYDHHMQRHSNCKIICDQCGKGFPVLSELHIHQVARHGVGPFLQCDHCPYKAPRKLNLIEHLRLHTGERPFTCEKCGLTFRRRAIWRNHLVCHMEKQYQCTYCPRKFYRHCSMLAHCNNVHERIYMFMCSICSITYTKTETVRRHMLVKHGIPREKQGKIPRINNGNNEFPGKVV